MASHDEFNFPTVNWFMKQSSAIAFQHSIADHGRMTAVEAEPCPPPCTRLPSRVEAFDHKRKALRSDRPVKSKRRTQTGGGRSKLSLPVPLSVSRRKYRKVTRAPGMEPHLNPAVVAYLQEWKSGQQHDVHTHSPNSLKTSSMEQSRIQPPEEQLSVGWNVPTSPLVPDLEVNCSGSASGSSTDGELLPNIDLLLNSPLNTKTHPWQERAPFEDNCECEFEYDISFKYLGEI